MIEKFDQPQEQASDRPRVTAEQLKQILEAHRKWGESVGKEGERANLQGADLRGANLQGANLRLANLQEANLWRAQLQEANLDRAKLFGANLQGADLWRAQLQKANLDRAKLFGANLGWANLRNADLRGAQGLTAFKVRAAKNWDLAFYSKDFLKKLGLPPDHNERLEKKLAELEKEKKATDAQ